MDKQMQDHPKTQLKPEKINFVLVGFINWFILLQLAFYDLLFIWSLMDIVVWTVAKHFVIHATAWQCIKLSHLITNLFLNKLILPRSNNVNCVNPMTENLLS